MVLREGAALKKYPEHFVPETEELGANEMRITAVGSGNPPVRRGQAATSWLVELGNGDKFIFDVGGGTVPALWSLRIPLEELDKLFVTHLHLDHVGGIFNLWDSMGWVRNTPLRVWGFSGSTPELGVAAFIDHVKKAGYWHTRSKTGAIASGGMELLAHEFDASQFNPKNPRALVYDENGVKIYAFPTDQILIGAVGYRLEWNERSMAFTGDSIPTRHEAEQAKGVDVFIHELFIDAPTFAKKNNMPLQKRRRRAHFGREPRTGFLDRRTDARGRHTFLHERLHDRRGIRGGRVDVLRTRRGSSTRGLPTKREFGISAAIRHISKDVSTRASDRPETDLVVSAAFRRWPIGRPPAQPGGIG